MLSRRAIDGGSGNFFEGAPTPEAALALLQEHKVTNLATVPTLLRGIMALGRAKVASYRLSLRCISSCGEPLNSEVIRFFNEALGIVPRDHFGSSENGLPLGNCNSFPEEVFPGSMGLPLPGFEMAVVDEDGHELPDGEVGLLAQRPSEEGYYASAITKIRSEQSLCFAAIGSCPATSRNAMHEVIFGSMAEPTT